MEVTNIWIVVIGAIGAFFILSPFLSKRIKREDTKEYTDWQQKKEQIFSQLTDLEYDFQMDKLSEQDYKNTKAELVAKAAQYVTPQTIDRDQIEQEVDEEIKQLLEGNPIYTGEEDRHEK